jgi:hypothetical protein
MLGESVAAIKVCRGILKLAVMVSCFSFERTNPY